MVAQYLNVKVETDTGSSLSGITHSSYVVPSGTDKILMIAVFNNRFDGNSATCTCTFDGNACTEVNSGENNVYADQWGRVTLFRYALGSSTPTGDIVVTFSASNGDGAIIIAQTVTELVQQAQEADEVVNTSGYNNPSLSDSITTLTDDAVIITACVLLDDTTPNLGVIGTNHVLDQRQNDTTNNEHGAIGHRVAGSAGAYSQGYDNNSNAGFSLVTAAFEFVTAGSDPLLLLVPPNLRGNLQALGNRVLR